MQNKKLLNQSKEVIQIEINALKNLKKKINESFGKVIKTVLSCKNGKIIISGVGKSGIIARKWAATLSSTGTPSFFLDASNSKPSASSSSSSSLRLLSYYVVSYISSI